MEEERKEEVSLYIEKASLVILGLFFILFPITFTNLTTDIFALPKQALTVFTGIILAVLFGLRMVLDNKVKIRRTPFDLPVILFFITVFLSSLFSPSLFDSLQNFVPFLFAGVIYFAITQNSKNEKSLSVLLYCFLAGAVLASFISVASFFNINIFPFDFTKTRTFTTLGTVLDEVLYLLLVLPIGAYFLLPFVNTKSEHLKELLKKNLTKVVGLLITSIAILIGLIISIYSLIKLQQPTILPITIGFQTALSSISQDSTRILQGFLLGSGFGEYFTAFAKFKQSIFNLTPFWNLTFYRSSSFVLELLATTGVLGFGAYLFLCYRILRQKPLFIPLIIILVASFVAPFSFYHSALLFFVLGIYASLKSLTDHQRFFDVEIKLVALKKGLFSFSEINNNKESENTKILSYISFALILVPTAILGFFSIKYLISNINFQKSLVAASQNNGSLTYQFQTNAISTYGQSDVYQRVFSQTNLSLANSLISSVPQGSTPSAQTTQTVYTLVQQSINAARSATNLSPQNTINWQNLATIYRNLIGFGQNADSFAILAGQQAEALDPTNPQEYINLGGIYYQLQSWDKAQEQFQQAISLKSDYPNAYYNLGHTLMQKGDLRGALLQFQTVKQLVANDPTNLGKINQEIQSLENQINQQQNPNTQTTQGQTSANPLNVNSTSTALPAQNPPVKIPAPQSVTITPTPSEKPSPTPTP